MTGKSQSANDLYKSGQSCWPQSPYDYSVGQFLFHVLRPKPRPDVIGADTFVGHKTRSRQSPDLSRPIHVGRQIDS